MDIQHHFGFDRRVALGVLFYFWQQIPYGSCGANLRSDVYGLVYFETIDKRITDSPPLTLWRTTRLAAALLPGVFSTRPRLRERTAEFITDFGALPVALQQFCSSSRDRIIKTVFQVRIWWIKLHSGKPGTETISLFPSRQFHLVKPSENRGEIRPTCRQACKMAEKPACKPVS